MKTNKILATVALAFAAAVAVPARGETLTGDIVDVRVVDIADMVFDNGVAHASGEPLCTPSNPLVAGHTMYIRVRMLVANHDAVRGDEYGTSVVPLGWSFQPTGIGSALLNTPKLGLWIGERAAYAEVVETGPFVWQREGPMENDDAGDTTPPKNTKYRYFSDLYFAYTVQPGDLGFPVKLMNSSGSGPASMDDETHGYYILNVSGYSPTWTLMNTESTVAKFWYGDIDTMEEDWPTGKYADDKALKNYDLSLSSAYVKTIDFDNNYVDAENGIWREVLPGMSAPPGDTPRLEVGGGSCPTQTVVYVWSADESVVVPVASGANTTNVVDGKIVLTVVVPKGAESVDFKLKGANDAATGTEALIYMSSEAAGNVSKPSGELVNVAVSRTIRIAPPRDPSVTLDLDGAPTKEVTADEDYVGAKARLALRVSPACDEPITVRLKASVSGDDTLADIDDLFDANIIRIAEGDYGGDPLDKKVKDVTIAAGEEVVYLNVYVLGGTSKTGSKGVNFSLERVVVPEKVKTDGNCTLKIKRSTPVILSSDPAFTVGDDIGTISTVSGSDVVFTLGISDSYRDFYDTSKGYTFRWSLVDEDVEDAEDITYDEDIDGFQGTAVFNNVTGDDGVDLSLYVVNPDGMVSKPVKYKLIVKESKQTTVSFADPTDRLVFAEGEDAWLSLGVSQAYGSGNSYIFIDSDDAATLNCITTELTSAGAQLVKGRTRVDSPRKISFTDGGKDATIKAVLSKKEKVKDPVTTYTSGTLSFTITNVPPELLLVSFAGQSVDPEVDYGKTIEPVACGVLKTFSLSATDVSQADIDAGIMAEWRIGAFVTNVVATNSFKYALQTPNTTQEVRIRLKDKDMATYPAKDSIRFKVPVVNNPHVTVESDDGVITFTETSGKIIDGKIIVSLSEIANAELNVRLKIAKAGDGGFARLETGNGVAWVAEDDDYIEYDVTFNAYQPSRPLRILGMDGTPDTEGGLTVDAEVTTETTNADGVPWNEFYAKAEQVQLVVVNAPPEILRPSLSEVSVTNKNASINTPYPILYACRDVVTNDLIKGVTMEISVDGTTVLTTNVTDTAVRTNNIEFTTAGLHSVVVSALDKDGGYSVREWLFFVTPAKVLKLRAHGPASATISISGDSVRYGSAGGLGAGRVFAGQQEVGPQQIRSFVHTYAFNEKEPSADAWAFSYKASDGDDDGTLPAPDWPIDEDGDWSKDTNISKHYCYTNKNYWGSRGYDSFFYAWACDNVEASSSSGSSSQAKKLYIDPETAGVVNYTSIPLPSGKKGENSSGNQSQGTEVIVHPEQIWEAIFSREYMASDNCGDINIDGIPDLAVCNYGMDVLNLETTLPDFTTYEAGDLALLDKYNNDKDKDGNDAPDYLPSTETSIYGSLIPGLSGTWVTYGTEFNAKTELRGYHEGLNDAMEQLGFAIESDRIYAEQDDDGKWQWTENCTISKLEWYAWREYAAANGLDPNDSGNWSQWSPERPTSPILNDTDGDGFEDGYEYFFWYRAHVGYMDGGVYRRLTGRRYDPRNPGEGVFISPDYIATLMDPRVATDMASAKTRDTDNDGLPDLLEFMIGTNPFDFDTDGDGLPDGWELMVAGLNPLLPVTAKDTLNDAERNYDGDAMAITSFALEKLLDPAPAHPEKCQFTTFAVIDPDGDSDGVQWYAATNTAECVSNLLEKVDLLEEEGSKLWTFTLADGSKKKVVSTMEPVVIDGGLAVSLPRDVAYLVEASEKEGEGDDAVDILTRGWPVRLPAGTKVSGVKALTSPNKVYMLKLTENIPNIAANAAWIYGRGSADATRGAVAKTAADYGCLALARPLAVPKDRIFCAPPKEDRDVALLHYLVYQQCGFDPRTAWCARDPLAARWGKTIDGEIVEGIESDSPSAKYVRHPARTREYRTYDEFLVYSFFLNNGCDMTGYVVDSYAFAPYLARVWGAFTTNPQGPDEPERIPLAPSSDAQSAVGWNQYFFGTDSPNGADTDGDGVPDGWELYVMAGPKARNGKFVFAPPYAGFRPSVASADMEYSYFSPFRDYAHATETLNKNYVGADADDEMNEFQEFEGTDSTAWYSVAQDPATTPYSETIVHDGEWKWFNKFFPTDPWNKDTDGDGLEDNKEGESFAYGTPADDGALICIPGGGLNPCSVDTDFDGLPDPWEVQFKGETPFPGDIPEPMASHGDKATDADGNEIGNYLQGLVDGMDGTAYDAQNSTLTHIGNTTTYVIRNGVTQVVDRDYDHDGLEPWQEYFTGMMRCWRYDDTISPWIPIPVEAYQSAEVADYDVLREWYEANKAMHPNIDNLGGWDVRPLPGGDGSQEEIDDFWYSTLVDRSSFLYNPGLVTDIGSCAQYLSYITNTWDAAYGKHYWFYDRIGDSKIEDIWAWGGTKGAPKKYACCSPINPDSDHDGMDDYYELFHGMNPLLGASGVLNDLGLPCDLVYDSWGESFAYNANHCYWTAGDNSSPGSDFDYYDFVRNPWMNGSIEADPDGDGIPNQTEAMMPKLASPALHTDPTPLWMTDSSYEYSLVRMFYRMPYRFYDAANSAPFLDYLSARAKDDNGNETTEVVNGEVVLAYKETFKHEFETLVPPRKWTETYWYKDFEGYHEGIIPVVNQRYGWFGTYNPDFWDVATDPAPGTHYWNWMFSFEENEGYDSDHDALSDEEEKARRFRSATDPLYADSPHRRQAMYFQGPERPSALQTTPQDKENYPVCAMEYPNDMTFRTFTVECWAKPDSIDDSVLVERAVWIGRESPGDEELMRKNFQLAIREGKWFAKFDPFGTRADDAVEVLSVSDATTDGWTHLAATYDGNALVLYVNGVAEKSVKSELLPAYGSQGVAIHSDQSYMNDMEYAYHAVIVGASAKTRLEGGTEYALDVTLGMGWDFYTRFYKGWIDEVRVWDGARTADEIFAAMKTRFDSALAAENRQAFFEQWSTGKRRDDKDADGKATEMPAELIYHWSFDSVPGAQSESAVAKAPLGFHDARAVLSRPDGYVVGWWNNVLNGIPPNEIFTEGTPGYAGAVYDDLAWVQWIPSTVAHLPRFDGTTIDSFFWSRDFMGGEAGTYYFANSAEPVSRWRQFSYNRVLNNLRYWTTPERQFLVATVDVSQGTDLYTPFEFTGRNRDNCGDDLIPLGGAYVRMTDNDVGLWDEQGASSNWEITGSDADGDGLPDWWERYADENYRPEGMDPSVKIGWDTIVVRGGAEMTAGEAYLRDLAQGAHMGPDGEISLDEEGDYKQVADEDRNGLPDWWESWFGVAGQDIFADPDNDGLSNYAEYLAFADYGMALDPMMTATDGHVLDYFRQVDMGGDDGVWYMGELVADHDFMEDWWEDRFDNSYMNRHEYDAASDPDLDGWSNFAEIRAGTDPSVASVLSIDETELPAYPTPVVEADVSLDTGASVNGTVVFQAWSSPTLQGKPDATWSISAGSGETTSYTRLLGMNPGTVVNVQLGPGSVVPDSISIDFCDPTAHEYHYNVESNGTQTLRQVLVIGTGPWQDVYKDASHSDDPSIGDIVNLDGSHSIGTVNYKTGEMMIDLGAVQETMGLIISQTASEVVEIETVLPRSYVRVGWSSKMLSGSTVTRLYLVEPSEGHLHEGKNTFVAFLDTDGNGNASAGEPLCVLRDVDIGWSRATDLSFELVADHPSGPNVAHKSSGALEQVRIFRTAVNGVSDAGARRLVFSRKIDFTDREYLSRADYVRADAFDLDWRYLVDDAMKAGIRPSDVFSADYSIYFGAVTNAGDSAALSFTKTFSVDRSAPAPLSPSESSGYIVRTARPTFAWEGGEGYTAFAIEVATNSNPDSVVWSSGIRTLPAHGERGYELSPEMYVGRELVDGTNYFWRIAQFNAKYSSVAKIGDRDAVWSDWAEFRTAVDSTKLDTGYGRVKVDVRYYGPATDEPLTNVFVGVFRSPDFTGSPLASVRLGDILGDDKATGDLAITGGTTTFKSVSTNNAVVLDGIPEGTVYVRSFVDRNGNGRRDVWETWGYANGVGSQRVSLYVPVPLTVSSKTPDAAECVVFMEDTDVNQNKRPDSLEDPSVLAAAAGGASGEDTTDLDQDGLSASEENDYGTDANVWDTDGDGMPDGWELRFADTDPLTPDADDAVSGDVMAYAVTNMTVITVWNYGDDLSATNRYAVADPAAVVHVGDAATTLANLRVIYDYGGKYGLGREVADPATELAGLKVHYVEEDAEVVLVHKQVYEAFGFDPTTAIPPYVSDDGSNTVYGANTKAFTALDKYLVARWREQACGIGDEVAMNMNRTWATCTLKPGDLDNDRDGIADGWELYVGKSPWDFVDRIDEDDGDGLKLVDEYDAMEPFDPGNEHSVYDWMSAAKLLLPGTPEFTDAEARRFGIREDDMAEDDDNDLLTNLEEIQAYYYDKTALADIDPAKAWSDGATPDYFRKAQGTWLGALFNGGEFIEPDMRVIMGIDTFAGVGTRDYNDSGWDAWSTARYSILSGEQTNDVSGIVSDELMLLVRYWNVVRPGEFTGATVGDAVAFFHDVWHDVVRLIDDEGNVVIETTEDHSVSGMGTIHHANAAQTTTQIVDFFGGQAKIEEIITKNKRDMTAADIVTPEPVVDLVVKYAGNGSHNLVLEAYQVNPVYPEYGEQLSAQWTTPVKFDAGVAKVNQLKTPALGALVQGSARFVAYIDVDGDGKLSAGDTSGETKANVGYLGCDLTLRLGDANTTGLPVISLVSGEGASSSNAADAAAAQLVAIVRTKVNGSYVVDEDGMCIPRGVALRKHWNNLGRDALYPTDFVSADYIGLDRYLAKDYDDESLAPIASVTYEIVRIPADLVDDFGAPVSKISVTNLNHYTWIETVETDDGISNVLHSVDQDLNEEITFRYSLMRDVPAVVSGAADGGLFSFTVPVDGFANTKFWLDIEGIETDANGYVLDGVAGDRKVIDADWLAANGIAFTAGGSHKVRVALGSDKFPEMPGDYSEWSAQAEFSIPQDAVRDGRLAVEVRHPTADLDSMLTVAAYEKADLANPVAVASGCAAGETVELTGLRPGADYYVAAWYVKDAGDGRASATDRRAYDTWGYYCTLAVTNRSQVAGSMAFDAVALKAEQTPSATNTVWLQDTDWNDNGVIDREETIRWSSAETPVGEFFEIGDLDLDGVPDSDDPDPVFDNGDDVIERDVMAYATVDFYCVMLGSEDDVTGTNWTCYVVTDPDLETAVSKLDDGRILIPRGTDAAQLVTLAKTYVYGGKTSKTLGLGLAVADPAAELAGLKVMESGHKPIALMHHQVYDHFGFNPNTANGTLPESEWVNTRRFTSRDKYLVTNYLAAVGAVVSPESWTNWTLNARLLDFDFDGVPDGWELYTMFGVKGVSALDKTAKASVINAWVADDRGLDPDGDSLANLREYDGGFAPTDPWQMDTDGDGVIDLYACQYHLKGGAADDDFDNDGLSNYAEYLITEVFKLAVCDPDNPKTSDGVADAYRKVGGFYLGELFSDHDRIEDAIEDASGGAMSRYAYDPDLDPDGNGWSNYAEARASTNGVPVRPTPTIKLALTYDGAAFRALNGSSSNATLRVEAYSSGLQSPDAVWNVALSADDVARGNATVTLGQASRGYLREGRNTFVCYMAGGSGSGDIVFVPGNPYGFVADVDVGWRGTKAAVELTRTSAVFARLDLYTAGADDRVKLYGADSGDVAWKTLVTNNDVSVNQLAGAEHLRIVPYMVSGVKQDTATTADGREFVELVNLVVNRVVAEFDVDLVNKRTLTEADFIRDGKFDIDWDSFTSEIRNNSNVRDAIGDVTAVKYRIVLGREGPVGKESNLDTNTVPVRAYETLIERRFESAASRTLPTQLATDAIQYGARPTFRWRLDEPAGVSGYAASSARLGCTYTAFQLQVKDARGNVVYDSGERRAPVRSADGVFSWTAPLCAGDLTATNRVFAPVSNWTWRVAMHNAKFKPSTSESNNGWSAAASFSTAVGAQQEMNDNGYGQINVAVRYAGPSNVLERCARISQQKGIVRVQAFESPDFTGDPVAATIATNKAVIGNTMDISNTVALVGLKMGGTYYVRAFIDSNGNGVKDDWESWGCVNFLGEKAISDFYAPKAITLDTSAVRAPVVGLFIEDSDTDQDWMPDAWEYADNGWTGDWETVKDVKKASVRGAVAIDTTGFSDANLSTGLPGAPLTVFENGSFAQQLLGIPSSGMTFDEIRAAIEKTIQPTTVRITALTLDSANNKVVLTLDADVAPSVAGRLVSQIYGIEPGSQATVAVKVYKKNTLIDAAWQLAETIENVKIGADQSQVIVPLNPALDLTSGFYQVVVEPTP